MKPYFAKYLPVEGEIKEDNAYFIGKTLHLSAGNLNKPPLRLMLKKHPEVKTYGEWLNKVAKKAKLFLCSADIQVGDKKVCLIYPHRTSHPFSLREHEWVAEVKFEHQLKFLTGLRDNGAGNELFKVIGEISPDALNYVKEGDEFDEDQVIMYDSFEKWEENYPDQDYIDMSLDYFDVDEKGENTIKSVLVEVKCSQCNTFH